MFFPVYWRYTSTNVWTLFVNHCIWLNMKPLCGAATFCSSIKFKKIGAHAALRFCCRGGTSVWGDADFACLSATDIFVSLAGHKELKGIITWTRAVETAYKLSNQTKYYAKSNLSCEIASYSYSYASHFVQQLPCRHTATKGCSYYPCYTPTQMNTGQR